MAYVYIYLDPRKRGNYSYGDHSFDYEPFYIGMSSRKTRVRMYDHLKEAETRKSGDHPKIALIKKIWSEKFDPIVRVYRDALLTDEAYDLEKDLILKIGRKILNEGPLTNLEPGGAPSNVSEEALKRIKILGSKNKSRKQTKESVEKRAIALRKAYAEGRMRGTKGMRGKWTLSDDQKKKLSESRRLQLQNCPRKGSTGANWKGFIVDDRNNIVYETMKIMSLSIMKSKNGIIADMKKRDLYYFSKNPDLKEGVIFFYEGRER